MSLSRKILLCFILCLNIWLGGLLWFITQIPAAPVPDHTPTDAIIVLTGGSSRLEYGLQLLAEGKGKKLFVSGVHENISVEGILRHAAPNIRAKLEPIAAQSIVLGRQAENTIGNAEETARWLKSEGYTSIHLVTANYHMPRSVEEFEEATDDVKIIPAPVFPDDFTLPGWWEHTDSRVLLLTEYHKYIAAKLRHWFLMALHRT